MKIGLYFGSFNPIHIGHWHIAYASLNKLGFDEIWFVLTNLNPFKNSSDILTYEHREELIRATLNEFKVDKIKLCVIEKDLPLPNYTFNTLNLLKEEHPTYIFNIIIGSDNALGLHTWKNYQTILNNYKVFIFERGLESGFLNDYLKEKLPNIKNLRFVKESVGFSLSSTYIRNAVKSNLNVSYLLPQAAFKLIKKNKWYE